MQAWNFYCRNANAFVQQFGLMPSRLEDAGFGGVAKDVFLDRLALIHDDQLEAADRRIESIEQSAKGLILAEDPT